MPSVRLKYGSEYPVYISQQPQSQTVLWGGTATFTVVAFGAGVLDYQWRFNGTNILSATTNVSTAATNVLVLTNVQPSQAGNYSVRVPSVYGSALSANATLTVSPAHLGVGMHPFLTITGTVGKTLGIQYTTDLAQSNSWINLTNLTLTAPVQEWIDTSVDAVGSPKRFYRVVPIP